jgi:hypothetical protein
MPISILLVLFVVAMSGLDIRAHDGINLSTCYSVESSLTMKKRQLSLMAVCASWGIIMKATDNVDYENMREDMLVIP